MQGHRCRIAVLAVILASGLTLAPGCRGSKTPTDTPAAAGSPAAADVSDPLAPPSSQQSPDDGRPKVVVLGDSLTAGLGLALDDAYPTLLQQKIDAEGLTYQVVNAGVSGDTSAGGLSRVDLALDGDVRVLVLALGGNDALRGLPVPELRRNLTAIIERAQQKHVSVIIAGMEAPPNFGEAYTNEFRRVYPELAAQYRIPLIPFLLQGVAGIEGLNQRDGIHPTAEGARIVADTVWSVLRQTLKGS